MSNTTIAYTPDIQNLAFEQVKRAGDKKKQEVRSQGASPRKNTSAVHKIMIELGIPCLSS